MTRGPKSPRRDAVTTNTAVVDQHIYIPRLMRVLGNPPIVLPTHWDRFNVPYEYTQQPAIDRLQSFLDEVKAASPSTKVIVPKYLRSGGDSVEAT